MVLTGQHTFLESDPWDQTVKMQGAEVSEDSLLEAQPPGGFVSPNELDVQNGQKFILCVFIHRNGDYSGLISMDNLANPKMLNLPRISL